MHRKGNLPALLSECCRRQPKIWKHVKGKMSNSGNQGVMEGIQRMKSHTAGNSLAKCLLNWDPPRTIKQEKFRQRSQEGLSRERKPVEILRGKWPWQVQGSLSGWSMVVKERVVGEGRAGARASRARWDTQNTVGVLGGIQKSLSREVTRETLHLSRSLGLPHFFSSEHGKWFCVLLASSKFSPLPAPWLLSAMEKCFQLISGIASIKKSKKDQWPWTSWAKKQSCLHYTWLGQVWPKVMTSAFPLSVIFTRPWWGLVQVTNINNGGSYPGRTRKWPQGNMQILDLILELN